MKRREFNAGAFALVLAPRAFATARAPAALVTADEESRLVAVDLASGRILWLIPTRASPRSIETVGETAVVAHTELAVVSLVREMVVVHLLRGFVEPRYTAAHPDGRHAYVTDAARGEVVALDVVRGRVLAREHVGARARHITIAPNGKTLWVALGAVPRAGRALVARRLRRLNRTWQGSDPWHVPREQCPARSRARPARPRRPAARPRGSRRDALSRRRGRR